MKVFTIEEGVFKTEPLFVLGCTYQELRAYLKRRFKVTIDNTDDEIGGQMLTFSHSPWRVVWVRRANNRPVLVHEIFHLVTRICQDRGVSVVAHHPNGENGDETAAYLLEFFYTKATART